MILRNKLKFVLVGLVALCGITSFFVFNIKKEEAKTTFVICSDLDRVLVQKMRGISFHKRRPIAQTWALYKQLHDEHGIHLFLWTNNPRKQCNGKLKHLNKKYALSLPWTGIMCARHFKIKRIKKPKARYYRRAYDYTMGRLQASGVDISNTYLIFIDDKMKNVKGAKQAAQKYNLRIIAIHFTSADKLARDLQNYIA